MVQCYARRRSRRDVSSSRRRPEAREAQRFPGLFICTHAMADLLPVFLTLAGRRVVLVGGGRVAAAKLRPLIDAAADVRVVAPDVLAEIERSGVPIARRPFEAADLDGAWLAVAAATPVVNGEVARAAESRRIFVNAVDDPANATAFLSGVVRR